MQGLPPRRHTSRPQAGQYQACSSASGRSGLPLPARAPPCRRRQLARATAATPPAWGGRSAPGHRGQQAVPQHVGQMEAPHRSRQHPERFEQGTRAVRVKRLHVHRPTPSRPHDLRQALRVVLVGLVHLHLQRSTGVPGIKAGDVEPSCAQFMHQPGRHGAGLDPGSRIFSRQLPHHPLDLPWVRGALTAPEPASCLVHDARTTSAPPDPRRGWGDCAFSPGPCNMLTCAASRNAQATSAPTSATTRSNVQRSPRLPWLDQ